MCKPLPILLAGLLLCTALARPAGAAPSLARPVGGLVPLKSLSALPVGDARPHPGYPGSALRTGLFSTAAQWQAFAALAGPAHRALKIDWARERVVYVVFTGQTNALSYQSWDQGRSGTGVLSIQWAGIEPDYASATPGVFVVVPRAGLRQIEIRFSEGRFKDTKLLVPVQ